MYKDLSHLTQEEQRKIADRYYAGENVNKLIEELQLDTSNSQFYKLLSETEYEGMSCPYCGGTLMIPVHPKSAWEGRIKKSIYCKQCEHKPFEPNCCCNRCKEIRLQKHLMQQKLKEAEIQKKRQVITAEYGGKHEKIKLNTLSLQERIYLATLTKYAFCEEQGIFLPVSDVETGNPLAPTIKYKYKIVSDLIDAHAIVVNPESDLDAFSDDCETYYLYKTSYLLNVEDDDATDMYSLLNKIYSIDINDSIHEIEKEIVVEEAIEFLLYQLDKYGIRGNYSPGTKTYREVANLVNDFTVNEISYIVYLAASSALRYRNSYNVSNTQAANSVVGSLRNYARRFKSEGWKTNFSRNFNLKQSEISSFVFTDLLKKGEDYFYQPIDK